MDVAKTHTSCNTQSYQRSPNLHPPNHQSTHPSGDRIDREDSMPSSAVTGMAEESPGTKKVVRLQQEITKNPHTHGSIVTKHFKRPSSSGKPDNGNQFQFAPLVRPIPSTTVQSSSSPFLQSYPRQLPEPVLNRAKESMKSLPLGGVSQKLAQDPYNLVTNEATIEETVIQRKLPQNLSWRGRKTERIVGESFIPEERIESQDPNLRQTANKDSTSSSDQDNENLVPQAGEALTSNLQSLDLIPEIHSEMQISSKDGPQALEQLPEDPSKALSILHFPTIDSSVPAEDGQDHTQDQDVGQNRPSSPPRLFTTVGSPIPENKLETSWDPANLPVIQSEHADPQYPQDQVKPDAERLYIGTTIHTNNEPLKKAGCHARRKRMTETPSTPSRRSMESNLHRVSKPAAKVKTKACHTAGPLGPELLPAQPRSQPSQEELLFLLMHRNRIRDEAEQKMRERQTELETANMRLQEENRINESALNSAQAREENQSAQVKSYQAVTSNYKSRFEKLKDWTKRIKSEYDELHKRNTAMETSQNTLQTEKNEIRLRLHEVELFTITASEKTRTYKSKISEAFDIAKQFQNALESSDKELREKTTLLFQERTRYDRLEAHIACLQRTQAEFHSNASGDHRTTISHLEKFDDRLKNILEALNAEPKLPPGVDKCIELFKVLEEKHQVTPDDLAHIRESLSTISETVVALRDRTVDALSEKECSSRTLCDEIVSQISSVLKSGRTDPMTNGEGGVVKLQKIGEEFESRLKEVDTILVKAREGQEKATEQVMKCLAGPEHIQKIANEKQDQITKLTMKWNSECSQRALDQKKVEKLALEFEEAKEIVRDLTMKLKESGDALFITKENAALELKAEEQQFTARLTLAETTLADTRRSLEKTNLALKQQEAEIARTFDRKVAEKEQKIRGLEEDLERSVQQETRHTHEINRIDQLLVQQAEDIEAANEETKAALKREHMAKEQISELLKSREEANRVPVLLENLEFQDGLINDLRSDIKNLEDVKGRLLLSEKESRRKTEELHNMALKLRKSHETDLLIDELQQKFDTATESLGLLVTKLSEIEEKATRVGPLEEEIVKKNDEIENLKARPLEAEQLSNQISDLERKVKEWQQKHTDQSKDLAEAKKLSEKYQSLQNKNILKDGEISVLKEKLAIAEIDTDDYHRLQVECEKKDSQIAALQRKVAEMVQESPEIQETLEQIPEELPEGFFSQDVFLSLPEPANSKTSGHLEMETILKQPKEGAATTYVAKSQRRRADRTLFNSRLHLNVISSPDSLSTNSLSSKVRIDDSQKNFRDQDIPCNPTDLEATQNTTYIPESQLELPLAQQLVATHEGQQKGSLQDLSSSSLSDIQSLFGEQDPDTLIFGPSDDILQPGGGVEREMTAKRKVPPAANPSHAKRANSRPPSSSYGEPMLLEDLEDLENAGHQSNNSPRGVVNHVAKSNSRRTTNRQRFFASKANQENAGEENNEGKSGGREFQDRVSISQFQDSSPLAAGTNSLLSIPVSPPPGAAKERHQPNSAAKRRLEPDEASSIDRPFGSKRLKRTLGNLGIKKPGKRGSSIMTDPSTDGESSRAVGTGMITGSRQGGTIIGVNAPAPGKSQRLKASRKGSKNEFFSTRFGQKN